MKHRSDRLDSLLRSLARRSRPAAIPENPESPCPSAELLAVYFDRSADAGELARLETHLVGCGRCQAVLAAMARADCREAAEQLGSAVPRAGPARRWHGLVPAGIAVSAVLLWVVLRSVPSPPIPVPVTPAETVPVLSDASALTAEAVPESSASEQASGRSLPPARAARSVQSSAPSPAAHQQTEVSVAASAPAAARRSVSTDDVAAAEKTMEGSASLMAREAPADRVQILSSEQRITVASSAPDFAAIAPPVRVAEPSSATPETVATAGHFSLSSPAGPLAPFLAVSPDSRTRWRVGSRGRIEFSRDGGQSWELQRSEVSVDLLAAHAPSDSICWVVGRDGTVLRTTDARTWQKLNFPARADLVRVLARDDRVAFVFAANGLTFATQDGGYSWEQVVRPTEPR
jgi:hypothetical protein